ncbi:hypothetical protein CupriaWKF_22735 [Cupriavidus sp. WKF15]|uniref:hypothetical protein n=1 Tax=Cupriavidus sp. WKF15 TaxID=3032282 RepID=UPI0023E24524|nr:hypothetical protein [Cupriavidus sp. WKF15]WER49928.1 hypothetical protein CupriaWKF_22735 [Cupriavidus sp. WKF15]
MTASTHRIMIENPRNVDRLLFGFSKLDFLDIAWLRDRFKKAEIAFEAYAGIQLKSTFPELSFSTEWLAKAWSLFERYAKHGSQNPTRRELPFLLFMLGLKAAWPMKTHFSRETWELAMEEGTARAKQMLMIVFIFHEDGGPLLRLDTGHR